MQEYHQEMRDNSLTYDDLMEMGATRKCKECKEHLEIKEFHRNVRAPNGIKRRCKHCTKAGIKCANKGRKQAKSLGLNMNKCQGCGIEPSKKVRICVDHNHETGRFRLLLCGNCNTGRTKMGDSTDEIRKRCDAMDAAEESNRRMGFAI